MPVRHSGYDAANQDRAAHVRHDKAHTTAHLVADLAVTHAPEYGEEGSARR
jgi:hypothetical protein